MRHKIAFLSVYVVLASLLASLGAGANSQTPTRPRTVAGSKQANSSPSPSESAALIEPTELKRELVQYPNPRVAFICGPQLKVNSQLNPFPWFDATQARYGHVVGRESPAIAPRVLTGTASIAANSRTVNG